MTTTTIEEGTSPSLLAKKQARDAKRKKLEAMFDQHKKHEMHKLPVSSSPTAAAAAAAAAAGESSSEQDYLKSSYQHKNDGNKGTPSGDVEEGLVKVNEDQEQDSATPSFAIKKTASKSKSYGGIAVSASDTSNTTTTDMRAEVQTLIHNDDSEGEYIIQNNNNSAAIVEQVQSHPRLLGALLLFVIMYFWWL